MSVASRSQRPVLVSLDGLWVGGRRAVHRGSPWVGGVTSSGGGGFVGVRVGRFC